MKIIFVGAVTFSARCLERILERDIQADVVGICTSLGSALNSDYEDLEPIALRHGIPLLRTNDINSSDAVRWMKSLCPDIIFCFGWSRLLKTQVLQMPPMGVVGFHPAPLPRNRGRHPLIWSLALGLTETASTFFFMDGEADSGPILAQTSIQIGIEDDAKTLYERVIEVATEQLATVVPLLQSGSYSAKAQNHREASYWRKRNASDGKIDWRMSSQNIYNLVRALTHPYPGAHFVHQQREVKVWKCRSELRGGVINDEPGKVVAWDQGPIIKAGSGAVELIEYDDLAVNISVGDYL